MDWSNEMLCLYNLKFKVFLQATTNYNILLWTLFRRRTRHI